MFIANLPDGTLISISFYKEHGMVLIATRKKNKFAWKRMKKLSYYGSLVVSAITFFYASPGLALPDTESSYVYEYGAIIAFAISASIAWALKGIRG